MPDKKPVTKTRTRHEILNILKREGATDSAQLSAQLGVSAMAVRQHLYELQEQGWVSFREEARQLGRPAKLWQLTEVANTHFPEGYSELTISLMQAMTKTFGQEGLDKLLDVRMQEQLAGYRAQVNTGETIRQRLKALARLRSAEGYMAEIKADDDGMLLFVENHCPICEAAKICVGLCSRELDTFRAVLGEDVQVERIEHILAGARRCAYRVRPVV